MEEVAVFQDSRLSKRHIQQLVNAWGPAREVVEPHAPELRR